MDGDELWSNSSNMNLFSRDISNPLSKYVSMRYHYGILSFSSKGIPSYVGNESGYISGRKIQVSKSSTSKTNTFTVNVDGNIGGYNNAGVPIGNDYLKVSLKGLPTRAADVETGDLWSDNGTIKIK
ncbi:MAG TPA: hypothetical protein VFC79_04670 [Tissierellaceae bacterium]|nr:hypothetical protein [Tissierellaceae bacterium]